VFLKDVDAWFSFRCNSQPKWILETRYTEITDVGVTVRGRTWETVAMAAPAQTRISNAVVSAVLGSPFHALLDRKMALLTITGRRSERRDGRVIHVLSHVDHRWWRNLKGGGHLSIRIGGVDYGAFGDVIEMKDVDRIQFVRGFWRDAYGRRLDADHAAELAHSAVIVRILISDD
jgi:hypothetical protein